MPTQALILVSVAGALGLAVLATLAATFFTVEQRTTAIEADQTVHPVAAALNAHGNGGPVSRGADGRSRDAS